MTMNLYKPLKIQVITKGDYSIVPIRSEDRYEIMKWRNEQMYHLRQNEMLRKENQDHYFDNVVLKLFEQKKPKQLLFSYLKNGECIGYGGLVHVNWMDRHAEISFIMKSSLEEKYFSFHWTNFLNLIEQVALEINLHKIFTYAFDIRPHLYSALEINNYKQEAILKEHCFFEGKYIDVLIHSKIFKNVVLRNADKEDVDVTFRWVNAPEIRSFSYNKDKVCIEDHQKWFYSKLNDDKCEYYILEFNGKAAGSIRFDIDEKYDAKISYLIDSKFTGKGLGAIILWRGLDLLKVNRSDVQNVYGYVLKLNKASIGIFEKLHFIQIEENKSDLKYQKNLR